MWHRIWQDVAGNQRPDPTGEPQRGDWPHGWQQHASRTRNLYFRDRVLPSLPPARRAVLQSQSGPHAGAWLSAIPGDAMRTLPPADYAGSPPPQVAAPVTAYRWPVRPLAGMRGSHGRARRPRAGMPALWAAGAPGQSG